MGKIGKETKKVSSKSEKESYKRFVFQVPSNLFEGISLSENKPINIQALKKGKFRHPWWGVMKFDDSFFNSLISNFNLSIPQEKIAFDFKHVPDWGAAAWVNKVFVDGDALMASVSLTERGRKSIEKKEFIYFSIEYTDDYLEYQFKESVDSETGLMKEIEEKISHGPTLLGGGLTNRPFMKGMKPVSLSEDGSMIEFEEIDDDNENEFTEGTISMKDLETLQAKQKELEDKIKELEDKNDTKGADELKALSEKLDVVTAQVKELAEKKAEKKEIVDPNEEEMDPELLKKKKKAKKADDGETLSDPSEKKFEETARMLSEKDTQIKKLSDDIAALTGSVKSLMESNQVLQSDKYVAQTEKRLEDFRKLGAFPATIKAITPILLSNDAKKVSITLSEDGKSSTISLVDFAHKIIESIPKEHRFSSSEMSESIISPTGDSKELSIEEVEKYAKENSVTFEEAIVHFSKEGRIPE